MTVVRFNAEIIVEFDKYRPVPTKFKKAELREAIASAVSGCSQIENIAGVTVGKIDVGFPEYRGQLSH